MHRFGGVDGGAQLRGGDTALFFLVIIVVVSVVVVGGGGGGCTVGRARGEGVLGLPAAKQRRRERLRYRVIGDLKESWVMRWQSCEEAVGWEQREQWVGNRGSSGSGTEGTVGREQREQWVGNRGNSGSGTEVAVGREQREQWVGNRGSSGSGTEGTVGREQR
jgi:hypothetical protein